MNEEILNVISKLLEKVDFENKRIKICFDELSQEDTIQISIKTYPK